jgi:hypothetical protein
MKSTSTLFAAPVLLLTAVLTWQSQQPRSEAVLEVVEPKLDCQQPPRFRVGYQREANGVSINRLGVNFNGFAWIQAAVCGPGTLSIRAEGEVAANEAPVLQVSLETALLLQESFEELRTVRVRVPSSGRLVLGYFNDYYRSEARVATLESLEVLGTDCKDFEVEVPEATGGEWNKAARTASLVSSVPMTIRPCSAGVFSVRVVGRAGLNVFPNLTFRQNNIIIKSIQLSAQRQNIVVQVTDAPISVMLANPYFKQIADRNLNIRALVFTPDPSTAP